MSGAGVHSSRGDGYQITIAADWAIRALSESIDWIELDSTDVDALGQRIAVDDVIIARTHEPRIYCQCKKNHPTHSSWTVSSLHDDLEKAGRQLASDSEAWVYFYSQNNFGELSVFQEHASTQPNAKAFSTDLPDRFHKIQADLAQCWSLSLSKAKATIFQFLRRLRFQVTEHMEDLRSKQVARLAQDVTQSEQAYKLLTAQLDAVTRRFETGGSGAGARPTGRFTRNDLLQLLESAGSIRTPSRSEAEIDHHFRTASAVGRVWRRTIRKGVLPRRALGELFELIEAKPKTILIHDAPGYGKTCLLLDCVERLEICPSRFVLFVQGRSYAHCKNEHERIAAGLPPNLFELIARAAEYRDVIVIIDSLDVLSLAQPLGSRIFSVVD